MKNFFRLLKFNFIAFFFGTLILYLIIRIDLFKSNILFFSTVISLIFTLFILLTLIILFIKRLKIFNYINNKDILIFAIIFLSLHYNFHNFVAFNTSRSASMMMMGHFYQNNHKNFLEEELNDFVYKKYFVEENAVKKRLDEQVALGHLHIEDGKYKITKKGYFVVYFFGTITNLYNKKKNYAFDTN